MGIWGSQSPSKQDLVHRALSIEEGKGVQNPQTLDVRLHKPHVLMAIEILKIMEDVKISGHFDWLSRVS